MENFQKINNQKIQMLHLPWNVEKPWDPRKDNLRVVYKRSIELAKYFVKNGLSVSIYGRFDFNELTKDGVNIIILKYFNVRRKSKYLILWIILIFTNMSV